MKNFLWYRDWKNGGQGTFWGRGRRPRPRNGPRPPFFQSRYHRKFSNYTRKNFPNTKSNNKWRRVLFRNTWLFKLTSLYMVISIMCIRKRVSKFIQFFAFLWLFKLTPLFMVRFSKKVGYPTFYSLLVKLLLKNSKMASIFTYPLLSKSWATRNLWGSTVKLKVWLEVRYPKREGSKRSQEKWVLKISYKTWKLAIISLVTVTDFIFCKNKLSWKFSNWLELTCKS